MTEDEKLVGRVAEAMWNALKWHSTPWAEALDDDRSDYLTFARAAIAAVREHDKETLITGAMRGKSMTVLREVMQKYIVSADSTDDDLPSSLTVRHRHMEGGIKG